MTLTIDGSLGEGGGQVLRTALSLSMAMGRPFRIERIRAGRERPGLQRQHLTAVEAAARLCGARVAGAVIGSQSLDFEPGSVSAGRFEFAIGSAGSTTLVLQTLLPALLLAGGPSTVAIEGGTHNPWSPPFDFLAHAFAPMVRRMGPSVELTLERPGFYPAGGGRMVARLRPAPLRPLLCLERGAVRRCRARAILSRLPRHIGEREAAAVRSALGWTDVSVEEAAGAAGPGNVLVLEIECEQVTEVFTAFGERGKPAEAVAAEAAAEARTWMESGVPVGPYLADQLLLYAALAPGSAFLTGPLTLHARTNVDVIRAFLGERLRAEPAAGGVRVASVGPAPPT